MTSLVHTSLSSRHLVFTKVALEELVKSIHFSQSRLFSRERKMLLIEFLHHDRYNRQGKS